MWRRLVQVAAVLGAAGFVIGGVLQVRVQTSMESFLPQGDPVYRALDAKAAAFGGDPIVVILEAKQGGALLRREDQLLKLVRLEGKLHRLADVAAVYGPATMLNQTAGAAQDLLAQISGRRDALQSLVTVLESTRHVSQARLAAAKSALAAFDLRYGSLIVRGLPAGLPTLTNPNFIDHVVYSNVNQLTPRASWRFLVPAPNAVTVLVRPRPGLSAAQDAELVSHVNHTVSAAGLNLAKVTVTGFPAIAGALSERARTEAPLLGGLALLAVGLVFWLSRWSIRGRSRLRPLLVALGGTSSTLAAYGWLHRDLSLGVVAFLPILLGIGSDFPLYLSRAGSARPPIVAACAAGAGFGALALSPLPFVRELGIALVVGLAISCVIALVLRRTMGIVEEAETLEPRLRGRPYRGQTSMAARVLVGVLACAAALTGWLSLSHLSIEGQPDQLAHGLPEMSAARHAEALLRSSGEVSILVSAKSVAQPSVIAWSEKAEASALRLGRGQLRPILTLGDLLRFVGTDPSSEEVSAALEILPPYIRSAVVTGDLRHALMIFGLTVSDVHGTGRLVDQLEAGLPAPPSGVTFQVVGLPVAAARGLELVSQSRTWINLLGIAVAAIIILVGLRSWRPALAAMLTVLVSTGWVLGALALTGASLSPLTIAIGSLSTATGCEFSVMLSRGDLRRSLRLVGTAAAAGIAGYLMLAASELALLRDFGLLLAAGVAASFVAAAVVTWLLGSTTTTVTQDVESDAEVATMIGAGC